jgi:hypothetical protein
VKTPDQKLRPETWLDLEKLAAQIYEELEPESTVVHDAHLRGVLSATERQIDVLIEHAANKTRAIVDCKDWSRRANVNDVGAFSSLVEDVQATSGIMVCNKGFSMAARSLARNKGISLCKLHDVTSRRWRLDVLIPVVWVQAQLLDLRLGFSGRFAVGDSLSTIGPPDLRVSGRPVDPLQSFVDLWNSGALAPPAGGKRGRWTAETPVEIVTLEGAVRYGLFRVEAELAQRCRLGYLTPRQSRGIVDVETNDYRTVRLNAAATLLQQPEDGWREIGDPSELAISPRATVLTLAEVAGIRAKWTGIQSMIRVGD